MQRVLLFIIIFGAAQLHAAQPGHPTPHQNIPVKSEYDELLNALSGGKPVVRVAALYRVEMLPDDISTALASRIVDPPRPVTPRSFAMQLRAALDGENDLLAALDFRTRRATLVNGKAMPLLSPAEQKTFAANAKNTSDAELLKKLAAFPYIAAASQENCAALAALLSRNNAELQELVLDTLARHGAFPVSEALIRPFVASKSARASSSAARILARQNDSDAPDQIIARLRAEPLMLAGIYVPAVASFAADTLDEKFTPLLEDPDPRMQLVAAGYLLANKPHCEAALARLVASLDASIPDVQITAAWLLFEFGTEKEKDLARRKICEARMRLAAVFQGVASAWSAHPDSKPALKALADHELHSLGGAETGFVAINLRDAMRLNADSEAGKRLDPFAKKLASEGERIASARPNKPAPPPKPAKPRNGFITAAQPSSPYSCEDRYFYSIMATVLSESDPGKYHAAIDNCVKAIVFRQLGCGLWSYRDPSPEERENFKDGYENAPASDYEFPQAFYALSGLESAIVNADAKVDPVIFLRAMRGLLYSQYLDGSFSNYPQPSTRQSRAFQYSWVSHTATGLGMLAICLRQGKSALADEPDVITRGFIARQGAWTVLRQRVLNGDVTAAEGSDFAVYAVMFSLRELAYTFGNEGLISEAELSSIAAHTKTLKPNLPMNVYQAGFPEPDDTTTPPWEERTDIGPRTAQTPKK